MQTDDARIVTWPDPEDGSVCFGVWPLSPDMPPPPDHIVSGDQFKSALVAMRMGPGAAVEIGWQLIQAAVMAAHFRGHLSERNSDDDGCGVGGLPPGGPPPEETSISGPAMTPDELRQLWEGRHIGNKTPC